MRPCLQFSCYYENQSLLRPVGTATPGNLGDSHLLPLSAFLSRASFSSFGPSNLSELAFSLEHGTSNKEVAETGVTLPFAFLFLSPSVCHWVVIIGGSKEREIESKSENWQNIPLRVECPCNVNLPSIPFPGRVSPTSYLYVNGFFVTLRSCNKFINRLHKSPRKKVPRRRL